MSVRRGAAAGAGPALAQWAASDPMIAYQMFQTIQRLPQRAHRHCIALLSLSIDMKALTCLGCKYVYEKDTETQCPSCQRPRLDFRPPERGPSPEDARGRDGLLISPSTSFHDPSSAKPLPPPTLEPTREAIVLRAETVLDMAKGVIDSFSSSTTGTATTTEPPTSSTTTSPPTEPEVPSTDVVPSSQGSEVGTQEPAPIALDTSALTAMGFSEDDIRVALAQTNDNINEAMELLLQSSLQ